MEVDEPSKAAADAAATETVKPVVLVRLLCADMSFTA